MSISQRFITAAVAVAVATSAWAGVPVRRVDAMPAPKGLDGRNIAVWQSHGRYYNEEKDQWLWQRAHLMQTIEDLYTSGYVLDLLVPMLENAGAYVMLPRERDLNHAEVIVDADSDLTPGYAETSGVNAWRTADKAGFMMPQGIIEGRENPFEAGTVRVVESTGDAAGASTASWTADIPDAGTYSLYISYATLPESSDAVRYTVNSLAGAQEYIVDQTMGGGTWMYLGDFAFDKGRSAGPTVSVTNVGRPGTVVTADAVRIGGGMGNIGRGRKDEPQRVSGLPRWLEGARYWLQWAGAPDWVYASSEQQTDYNDDYRSRPTWVNWLAGGSARLPKEPGLNIPVDLAIAIHSDAGVTADSTIYGTLGIYSTDDGNPLGDKRSRANVNKRLTERVVDQMVNDVRALHNPEWTKRKIRNRKYAECRIPMVPSMILEMLSHQNFADMRHGLNPEFRFDVARAIYKGILRHLWADKGFVVQPLPVNSFSITNRGNGAYRLTWQPTTDPLEPTAKPTSYTIEMATDHGVMLPLATVKTPQYDFTAPEQGRVYSFRVIARNDGGASMPSETLALSYHRGWQPEVLIINGFTRVSAPEWFDNGDEAGFLDHIDHGVPYIRDIAYTGEQYDFVREHPWVDDVIDPGFGASRDIYEGHPTAGNTFDYPRSHGEAIAAAGYPFVSTSLDGYLSDPKRYRNSIIDLIMGKQRQIQPGANPALTKFKAFTPKLQQTLRDHTSRGGALLVSGSYIGSDLFANPFADAATLTADAAFAREVLGIELLEPMASTAGRIDVAPHWTNLHVAAAADYSSQPNEVSYVVESPDAIVAADGLHAYTLMTYADTQLPAAVAWRHPSRRHTVVAMGIPFESITDADARAAFMAQALNYLLSDKIPRAMRPALLDPLDINIISATPDTTVRPPMHLPNR